MNRFSKSLILILLFVFLAWGVYDLVVEKGSLQGEVNNLSQKVKSLENENKSLAESINYFKNPENLLKELKSQFNYHEVGEKLIIIVPGATSSVQGTSTRP